MDTTFRSKPEAPAPQAKVNDKPNEVGAEHDASDIEPLEFKGDEMVLEVLGIEESIRDLPNEEKENIEEIRNYIESVMKVKGIESTFEGFRETFEKVREEFGIPNKASADTVLDRIGGIVKAYRSLSFVPLAERKEAFIKLAGMDTSSEMDKYVYKLMEDYQVWQQ